MSAVRPAPPVARAAKVRGAFPALLLALALVASLVTGTPAVAATQAPTFARTDFPFMGHQVVGDFNGDGSLDLAGQGYLVPSAQVRLNNGAGAFDAAVNYPTEWGQDVATGDFTSDGRLDLVLTHNNPVITFSLLTGNGNGTFNPPVTFPNTSGFDSPYVVPADLNNDGKLDLVIAHNANCFVGGCVIAYTISILLGNGDGTFQPTREVDVGRGTGEVAVGDFNRDGNKDLAIAGSSSQLYRLFGVGDGSFVQQPTLTLTADTFGVQGTDVDVADFNGDSIQDLVVEIGTNGSRTAILIGIGDGTFRPPLIITEPGLNIPQYTAVADFNGDGFQDLAISLGDGLTGLMEILNGNGDGTFQPLVKYIVPPPTSVGGSDIVAADFNGDSKPDIALARAGAFPGFLVLINSTGAAPPATPAAPTLLSPAQDAIVAQPVALDWTDVSAATSYRVQIDDSSTFSSPFVLDRTLTQSQLTAPTLAVRQHWWRARGINSAGTAGAWSSARRFTPQGAAVVAALSAVSLTPASVVGGNPSQGTITLTSAAPVGGVVVALSSGNGTAATVPASVTVAQGATNRTFAVTTGAVTTSTPVTITAGAGAVTRVATLTVTPPGQAATLTVTATGRSGQRVTSSPAGINVAVGSTGSASFTAGTAITLSVSGGRDAVWSGACASGGNKRRTCTFTLTGAATVTANVQ